jgi:hypothetical protein
LLKLTFCSEKSILEKVPWAPQRNAILQLLAKVFYRCLLGSLDLYCQLILMFLCRFIVWITFYLWWWDIEVIYVITVMGSICAFMSSGICFLKLVEIDVLCIYVYNCYSVPDGLLLLSIWSELLCLFWGILAWNLLFQLWE